ncbi:Sperm-associated antigen 1 [Theileria parva strain Muguga]|uniref:Sperm-associated antigen 1 n=1 Tax=Theileria parva strain Muguga TaxID=333668 RepID=UPI001C61EAA8|nr:Sperm-associated antigen 1 [Theileria parva strain Muguga]EAN31171.2 Sperm-associated antigen 1 [Theileria parva strain Muguga]
MENEEVVDSTQSSETHPNLLNTSPGNNVDDNNTKNSENCNNIENNTDVDNNCKKSVSESECNQENDSAETTASDAPVANPSENPFHTVVENNLFGSPSPVYYKERGNECFKDNNYNEAIDWYTKALERLEFSEDDNLRAQIFCNRAACHQALGDWESSISDCNDALAFNDSYPKAYLRRSMAFEKTKFYQKSHADLEKALQLDPSLEEKYLVKKTQLKKLADAEFETEKAEMLGKLKDLGNNLLGKIGLSLDNFKVQKNPETGSYNIQYQQ